MYDLERSVDIQRPWWWMAPELYEQPSVLYIEEEQEEQIFGPGDASLHHIEVNSHTLIQLERWFTAHGRTRVSVVGPLRARQWVMDMICRVGSPNSSVRAQGLKMLRCVQSRPLTEDDLAVVLPARQSILSKLPLPSNMNLAITLGFLLLLGLNSLCCILFHRSSLDP